MKRKTSRGERQRVRSAFAAGGSVPVSRISRRAPSRPSRLSALFSLPIFHLLSMDSGFIGWDGCSEEKPVPRGNWLVGSYGSFTNLSSAFRTSPIQTGRYSHHVHHLPGRL